MTYTPKLQPLMAHISPYSQNPDITNTQIVGAHQLHQTGASQGGSWKVHGKSRRNRQEKGGKI